MKVYDPILCMMVEKPDVKKVKDSDKYLEQAIKWIKEGKNQAEILVGLQRMGLDLNKASKYISKAYFETGNTYAK